MTYDDSEEVFAYMIGYNTGPLFGKDHGMHIPIYGFAFDHYETLDFIELYKQVSLLFVHEQAFSHSFTVFTHQDYVIEDLFDLGFGKRCVDAITEVKALPRKNAHIEVKEVYYNQLQELKALHQQHNLYYRQSPIYMPNPDEDALKDLTTWIQGDNHHLFMAKLDDQIVGYMRIEPEGESIISHHPSIMNITGAFVDPFYQNMSIGHEMLREVMSWLEEHNYPSLGVDYESLNPKANHFWKKYFTPYTYSLTRRIDERIEEYLEEDLIYALEELDNIIH